MTALLGMSPVALTAAGFTCKGIAAGSLAAKWQALITAYNGVGEFWGFRWVFCEFWGFRWVLRLMMLDPLSKMAKSVTYVPLNISQSYLH